MHQLCQDPEMQQPSQDGANNEQNCTHKGFSFVGQRSKRQRLVRVLLSLAQQDCSKLRKMALLTLMKIHFFDKDLFDKALQVYEIQLF